MNNQTEIYLAGGCFWGTEHFLKQIRGVELTQVGYANGNGSNPTYEDVCTDTTGFAEAVKVVYNPQILSLSTLLQLFFQTIDPTSLNRQGGDIGTQYRTGIYYTQQNELETIEKEIEKLAQAHSKRIMIEVMPLKNFYDAEEHHQDYLDKNPRGYCHIQPSLFELARQANREKA